MNDPLMFHYRILANFPSLDSMGLMPIDVDHMFPILSPSGCHPSYICQLHHHCPSLAHFILALHTSLTWIQKLLHLKVKNTCKSTNLDWRRKAIKTTREFEDTFKFNIADCILLLFKCNNLITNRPFIKS